MSAIAEELRVAVLHDLVTLARCILEQRSVNDRDVSAMIAEHASPLEDSCNHGDPSPRAPSICARCSCVSENGMRPTLS
jgi:hypothetical protein